MVLNAHRMEEIRMPPQTTAPVAPYRVTELSIEDGLDIAMWRTPGPWAVQDSLEAPQPDEGYWAVRDSEDRLIGYCCFGEKARPVGLEAAAAKLDVALGLAPQFTGRHLSRDFAQAVVDHARDVAHDVGDDRRLRCVVPAWNAVGRHTAESVGFRLSGMREQRGGSTVSMFYVYEM